MKHLFREWGWNGFEVKSTAVSSITAVQNELFHLFHIKWCCIGNSSTRYSKVSSHILEIYFANREKSYPRLKNPIYFVSE